MKVTFSNPLRVFVYRNLHAATWSIKCLSRLNYGRVIAHSDDIMLINASPKVNEKGRQQVLLKRQKNIHAGIIGHLVYADIRGDFLYDRVDDGYKIESDDFDPPMALTASRISYDPYRGPSFYNKATGRDITDTNMTVWFTEYGKVFKLNGT